MSTSLNRTVLDKEGPDPMHWREQMSALVDGELSPDEVVELMDAIERDPGLKTVWSRYQSMGPLLARANDLQPEARAANDSVFWRRLAVAASVVAATTLMWGVVDHHSTAGPTLAMAPESVWMSSAVGPMLRDPVLEELLQQHREWGDGGALQTSTGFLRSATLQYTP